MELYIYDSSGKDLYLDMMQELWKDAALVIAVFDVTSDRSLEHISGWLSKLEKSAPLSSLTGVIVGSKTDLKERRVVSSKKGQETTKSFNFQYFESSAKEAEGVEEPFFYLANEWHKLCTERAESFRTVI
ncbi:intraflagellar transport protein 27 homolog [Ornithodoros turicata]|uniref:intraflagellar transport protein 27 homolog n=1 Tax=Ornithodoros turicata TaxID=34597 RepID=UPI0031398765